MRAVISSSLRKPEREMSIAGKVRFVRHLRGRRERGIRVEQQLDRREVLIPLGHRRRFSRHKVRDRKHAKQKAARNMPSGLRAQNLFALGNALSPGVAI
jgi:hypothetical protein